DEHRFVALPHSRNLRDIHHALVHADAPDQWCPPSTDQYLAPIGRSAAEPVGITNRQHSDTGWFGGDVRGAIADSFSGWNVLHLCHLCLEGKRWAESVR